MITPLINGKLFKVPTITGFKINLSRGPYSSYFGHDDDVDGDDDEKRPAIDDGLGRECKGGETVTSCNLKPAKFPSGKNITDTGPRGVLDGGNLF